MSLGGLQVYQLCRKWHIVRLAKISENARLRAKWRTASYLSLIADPVPEALLKGGASVNARTKNGSTGLHLVALTGDSRIGQLPLKHKADVNAKTDIGESPLMIAALRDNAQLVRSLLRAGADINARDNHGETRLMHAMERSHAEIIQMLKDAGAKE